MSTTETSSPRTATARAPWSIANRVGLAIGVLYQAVNVLGVLLPTGTPGQPGPPMEILIADTVLSSVGVVLLVLAWITRRRLLARLGVGIAVIVALSAFPAFFVPGIPAPIVVLVSAGTLVALASSILILLPAPRDRRPS